MTSTPAAIRTATLVELADLPDSTLVEWATVTVTPTGFALDAVHLGDDGSAAAERAEVLEAAGETALIVRTVRHPGHGDLVLADSLD